ncbi:hypothetical protein [Synechocystis sp. LKSZ1]|uniref:hypothetical protein n=1 Tax=Synechocystis sp. LKSZ1 TaxID=3144951 RepID=UPI00336BF920
MQEYLFWLANASLTLRVIHYLCQAKTFQVESLTVIHQINGWVIRLKVTGLASAQTAGDLWAFLSEHGVPYQRDIRLQLAFWNLDLGESPLMVMRRYQLAIVSHGSPDWNDIEIFREEFKRGLGYCPETLA